MTDTALMKNLLPRTERKIRDDSTNSLKSPEVYDISQVLGRLQAIEAEAKANNMPRFVHRDCETPIPVYYPYTRETGITRVIYCISGQALLIGEDGETQFLSDNSVVILPPDKEYDFLLGRGKQNWFTIHWEPESSLVPTVDGADTKTFILDDCSIALKRLTKRVVEFGSEVKDHPNLLLSWINLMMYEAKSGRRSFSLVQPLDGDLEAIEELIKAIKESPEKDWNLTNASSFAGYSPFHLSRVFRSSVGIGLPKFVECCRTEVAINRLVSGTDAINLVADECGFGSSQAMRSAIREFTGFLPIELRGQSGE